MTINTLQLAIKNYTSIERLWKGDRTCYIALLISEREAKDIQSKAGNFRCLSGSNKPKLFHTIKYPLKSEHLSQSANLNDMRRIENSAAVYRSLPQVKRTFAIVSCSATDSLWNLGPLNNMKEILGNHWLHWFMPVRYSPHCDHNRVASHFPYGFELEALRIEYGLMKSSD